MILIDSNVFMYAGGRTHPHKKPSVRLLERVARNEIEAAVDAEVLQEILHRYRALDRWADGRTVYDLARRIVPLVFPVTVEILDAARKLMDRYEGLSARDALHAAAAQEYGIRRICSYDRDFDDLGDVERIEPPALE